MNNERAIIVHTEFVKQCVKVGRTVVEQLREALEKQEEISDEKLEQLFEPLIKFVEQETDTRVSRESDEIRAKVAEEVELQEKEKCLNVIRSHFAERIALNVNGKRSTQNHDKNSVKRLKKAVLNPEMQELVPEFKTALFEDLPQVKDPEKLIEDPLLCTETAFSSVWLDYCTQINLKIDPPADKLFESTLYSFTEYTKKRGFKFHDITSYAKCASVILPWYGWSDTERVIRLAKICDAALQRQLTPKELYDILPTQYPENDNIERYRVRSIVKDMYSKEISE